jgi:uncharacterized membrane protein HdeD (DUF308 family)
MAQILIGNWWALALRGVFAIIFAVIAFVWPGITAAALVLLFGAYALVDGIFALVAALRAARHHGRSGALLLEGILDLIIAAIVFFWPGEALVAIIYFIAIWAVITGIALIAAGIAMIRVNGEWRVPGSSPSPGGSASMRSCSGSRCSAPPSACGTGARASNPAAGLLVRFSQRAIGRLYLR